MRASTAPRSFASSAPRCFPSHPARRTAPRLLTHGLACRCAPGAQAEQLRQQNQEIKCKTQVELESLQEQLRVRKEKQYQLLEKVQNSEEAKQQAEDQVRTAPRPRTPGAAHRSRRAPGRSSTGFFPSQVSSMEERMRQLHSRNVELEKQLQSETRAKRSQEQANQELSTELENERASVRALQDNLQKTEQERQRMESEARDSGEQLREMAEKVFQLLERLKLAELGKTKVRGARSLLLPHPFPPLPLTRGGRHPALVCVCVCACVCEGRRWRR